MAEAKGKKHLDKRVQLVISGATAAVALLAAASAPGIGIFLVLALGFISGFIGGRAVGWSGWFPAAAVLIGFTAFLQFGPFSHLSGDAGLGVAIIYVVLVFGIASAIVGSFIGSFFKESNGSYAANPPKA